MRIFEDDYLWVGSSWLVHPYSIIGEALERYILELHQHGIIEHYLNLVSVPKVPTFIKGPEKLTMFMLSAGFLVWIITVLITCIEFICEVVLGQLMCKREKIKIIEVFSNEDDSNFESTERNLTHITVEIFDNKQIKHEIKDADDVTVDETEAVVLSDGDDDSKRDSREMKMEEIDNETIAIDEIKMNRLSYIVKTPAKMDPNKLSSSNSSPYEKNEGDVNVELNYELEKKPTINVIKNPYVRFEENNDYCDEPDKESTSVLPKTPVLGKNIIQLPTLSIAGQSKDK